MLNPCWSNTKRFLSILVVFGKSFIFAKISKISKTVLPCFGYSVVGWSSRMSQSWAHTKIFRGSLAGHYPSREKYLEYFSNFEFSCFSQLSLATCSRMEGPVVRGLRDFRGFPHDSLAGRTSSREKHLDKIFKIFVLNVLAIGPGNLIATWLIHENHVFCAYKSVFKCFQFFPRTFLTVHCLPHFKPL